MHKHFAWGMLIICLLSTSCITLVGKKNMDVSIYTENPMEVVYESDTLQSEEIEEYNSVKLTVPRSKDSLRFTIKKDTIIKDISIKSKLSGLYYVNIAYPLLWPGMGIDLLSSKRFSYKNTLLFDDSLNLLSATNKAKNMRRDQKINFLRQKYKSDKKLIKERYFPQKGDIYFNLSFPLLYPGYTILKPTPTSYMERGSALGFAGGLDYYYRNNRFVNLSASATFGGDITIGCGDDGYDDKRRFNMYHITASHNHRFKKFSFGYGLNHAYTDWWSTQYYIPDIWINKNGYNQEIAEPYTTKRKYATFGMVFNGYIYFFNTITFGIVYKPTFVRLNSIMEKRFCYEHQISFDLAVKIRLNRRK